MWLLPLARGAHVSAMLLVFGTLLGRLALGGAAGTSPRAWLSLIWTGAGIAGVAGLVWLTIVTAGMADAGSLAELWRTAPIVVTETRFGRLLLLRLALVLAASACAAQLGSRRRVAVATALAGTAVGLQAWTGHAAAIGGAPGTWLASIETLHLLAAGAWLGGLPALMLVVSAGSPGEAAASARRFSRLGLLSVLVLAATGLVQARTLIGGLPSLFGTAYGRIAVVKIGLFAALAALATLNRLVLLRRRQALRVSIAGETALGLAVVTAAALLANGVPGVHESPVWPFSGRLTGEAFRDPAAWRDVTLGLLAAAAAFGLVGWSLVHRKIAIFASGVILAVLSLPHLGPLLTDAYPTTFDRSPAGFSAASIDAGAELFATHCASCHGAGGSGDGARAADLPIPPADLTAAHLLAHTEGDLFWFIATGFSAPGGGVAMPAFATSLAEEARWNLVDYLLARNAGARFAASGVWRPPVRAPDFAMTCGGLGMTLADRRGQPVRLLAGSGLAGEDGARTVRMPGVPGADAACVVASPGVARAYGILIGAAPTEEFLIDAGEWLRAYWHPGDFAALRARIATLRDLPVTEPAMPAGHVH